MYLGKMTTGMEDYDAHRLTFLARGAFSIPLRSLESELMFYAGLGPDYLWVPGANVSGSDWMSEFALGYGRGLGDDSHGFVDVAVCFDPSYSSDNPIEGCGLGLTLRLGAQWK